MRALAFFTVVALVYANFQVLSTVSRCPIPGEAATTPSNCPYYLRPDSCFILEPNETSVTIFGYAVDLLPGAISQLGLHFGRVCNLALYWLLTSIGGLGFGSFSTPDSLGLYRVLAHGQGQLQSCSRNVGGG